MHSPSPLDKRVFHALDAGRGIAALVVVVYHFPLAMRGDRFGSGELAVDFFFALSGFVLAHAYLGKLIHGQMTLRDFIAARVIRLYPLYLLSLLCLLVMLGVIVLMGRPIPWSPMALAGKLPFAFLMLPSPSMDPTGYLYPFNIAAWSIFFELVINVVFALIARQVANPRTRWLLIGLSGTALAVQLVWQDVLGGQSWNTLLAGIPRVAFSFFLGIQLYAWHNALAGQGLKLHPRWGIAALAGLGFCLWMPASLWLKLVTIFALFPCLILALSVTELPQGGFGNALQRLGVLSYAVYAIHGPLLIAKSEISEAWGLWPAEQWLLVPIVLVVVVAASAVADRWFDRPARAMLQTRLRPNTARNTPTGTGTASN